MPAPILPIALGVAALAALVVSSKSASAAPKSSSGLSLPADSGPPGNDWGTPVVTQATAASGRVYTVWMWPKRPQIGVYTVAQLAGSQLWISFTYNADTDQSTPAKTNVMQAAGLTDAQRQQFLGFFKQDWKLPG